MFVAPNATIPYTKNGVIAGGMAGFSAGVFVSSGFNFSTSQTLVMTGTYTILGLLEGDAVIKFLSTNSIAQGVIQGVKNLC